MGKLEYEIIVDSREQEPLWKNCEIKGLKTGDYSIKGYEEHIAIERKTLIDLFGTLGSGHKRFKNEIERAQHLEYFAIIIEGSYFDCVNKNFIGSYFSNMKGYTITSILFTLHLKYGINFFFTNDKKESKAIIRELFKAYLKQIGCLSEGSS